MELLIAVINDVDRIDEVLEGFLEIGITGATVIDSHGMEWYELAGELGAAVAGSSSRGENAFLVQPDQQRLRSHPREAQVGMGNEALGAGPGDLDLHQGGELGLEPVPGGTDHRPVAPPVGNGGVDGGGETHDPRHIVRAGATSQLLTAAVDDRFERYPFAHEKTPDPLGPADLVSGDRDQVGTTLLRGDR